MYVLQKGKTISFIWQHLWLIISLFIMTLGYRPGFRRYIFGLARFLPRK